MPKTVTIPLALAERLAQHAEDASDYYTLGNEDAAYEQDAKASADQCLNDSLATFKLIDEARRANP